MQQKVYTADHSFLTCIIKFFLKKQKKFLQISLLEMADGATLWAEEKLKTLIEKIITRALDEQQENLFKTTNC